MESIFAHMEFLEKAPAAEEKRITRAEFKEAVKTVVDEMIADPNIEGMAKLLIPMTGAMFADKMEAVLFGKEK